MRIGIDIDDTICNTCEYLTDLGIAYDKKFKEGKGIQDKRAFRFIEMFDWTLEDVKKFFTYFHQIEGYKDIEVRKDAIEYIKRLKKDGYEIILISHRQPSMYCDVEKLTKEYLEKYHIPYDEMYLGVNDKGILCKEKQIDYMIDDSYSYLEQVKASGIYCVQVASDYEQDVLDKLYTWKEIYEDIKEKTHE